VTAEPRVVSLVPSASETLVALGITPIACTRFCELDGVPTVGGTKRPDIDAIVHLAPDLVVVNDEENRREDADALEAGGLELHSMSPRAVRDVGPAVCALASRVGVPAPVRFRTAEWDTWLDAVATPRWAEAFVAIWRRPWMSMGADTYGSSLLELLGVGNVLADARERYPEVTLRDVAARTPDLVMLPNEPYVFEERHLPEVNAEVPGVPVALVDGRDLFWWGIRTPLATERLRASLRAALSR
jgi:ABC-type hemin transport system substrate-binding protein